ncbi:MAG: primosomal protein N', partial [Acetobacteraceae bacterium]|nr:primosomal protein N' [Acetobacteraceae bacterium]
MGRVSEKQRGRKDTANVAPAPRVRVLLPLPLAGAYDYRVPPNADVRPGSFVVAPLNQREIIGVVWDREANSSEPPVSDARLKPFAATLPVPPMTASLRRFVDWVASYTLSPPGAVLRMAMSAPGALEPPPVQAGWTLAPPGGNSRPRITPERRRVLDAMEPGEVYAGPRLAEAAGVSPGVLRGMADNGLIRPAALPRASRFARPDPDHPGPALSGAQAEAAAALRGKVAARAFGVTLLAGVTGSGKTEVYLDAVAECLRQGRQALVMLPEIALSAQWLDRFRARFGVEPALWHSEIGSRTRRDTWRAVAEGEAPVVVGARSALFLPFPDLGLVVVDEEHETAFKQEDGVVYHARDMAVVRARLAGAACVLVSATPSLETLNNVETGRYDAVRLPQRHGGAGLPTVETIDLRAKP